MTEPVWLTRVEINYLHERSIREFGGSHGVRDDGLIDSAIARPINLWSYEPDVDLPALAASYAFGLAKNHGFVDGNKRIGFLAMGAFLYVNGWRLVASEPEAVVVMLELASGTRSEQELAAWLRERIESLVP